jgi:hypothetical protein
VAKNAQYAVNFVDEKASSVVTGLRLGGFSSTVERVEVDQALAEVIGDDKIPTPNYDTGLYTSTPTSDLIYDGSDDQQIQEEIDAERESRGLAPLTDPATGRITARVSEAADLRSQTITRLRNEILDLNTIIAGRRRRRQDTTVEYAELARLESQLNTLQNG